MIKFAAVAALCLVGLAAASDVVDTTDATFDEVIKSSDFVLMEFYAPWCGHCKKLTPEWEKAATELKGTAVVAKIDATAEPANAGKYDVKGYPTIKIFREGAVAGDYEGGRTADAIVKYVKGNSGPAVTVTESADQLESLKTENAVVVVGFELADAAVFEATAKKLRSSYTFATASVVEGEAANSIVIFKQFDEGRQVFDGEVTEETLAAYIQDAGIRTFDEIGPDNYKGYVDRGLPIGWLFCSPGDAASDEAKTVMEAIAQEYKGKISMVWIDATKYGGMAQRLGLKGEKFPSFALDREGQHYAFDETAAFEADALKQFVADFEAGTLAHTVKSEAEPAEHTVDGLTTVVGSTFEALVTNSEKPVLIEFYAPWCGHCKSLAPVYAKVAKAAADADVTIAMIDATNNDFPQKTFKVEGFPTIFWATKDAEPEQYQGGRDFDGFAKFLKEKIDVTISE